jgi:hypothetical protein
MENNYCSLHVYVDTQNLKHKVMQVDRKAVIAVIGNLYLPGQVQQGYQMERCRLLLEMTQLLLVRSLEKKMGLHLRRPAGIRLSLGIMNWHWCR